MPTNYLGQAFHPGHWLKDSIRVIYFQLQFSVQHFLLILSHVCQYQYDISIECEVLL